MKNYSYKKEYPFSNHIFIEKLKANTISSSPVNKIKRAYSDKANDRVFVRGFLNLKQEQFQVYTYPDLYDSFLTPYFFKRAFIFMAPSCIYGHFVGKDDEKTVVNYTICKTDFVKVIAIVQTFICVMCGLYCIISMIMNGISGELLLAFIIIAEFSIIIIMLLKIPRAELDALIKFMEDLEDES